MFTIVLSYVIAAAGVVMIGAGLWGFYLLKSEKGAGQLHRIYYAIMIGLIAGGVGLFGMARALRLLLVYYGP